MKIRYLSDTRVIMSNPKSRHRYFGWPSVARLKDGRIAVVASGYRLAHVCPFGKTVISYSTDEGESYTRPAPVIDTALDDRDGGILAFGESSVLVTSFNNTVEFQRTQKSATPYMLAYLDTVTPEEEARDLGAGFAVSRDGGVTFGDVHKSPITSPHGPIELQNGRLLWVGRKFSSNDEQKSDDIVKAYDIDPDSLEMTYLGEIENLIVDGELPLSCEPYAVELDGGRIIAHIRVQLYSSKSAEGPIYTVYQSESDDGGRSWTKPHAILPRCGGAPSHILKHSSGILVATYGHRKPPYGVQAMFSRDGGESWDSGYELFEGVNGDLGYPSTVELADGDMLTVFYAHESADGPAVIMQRKWRFDDEI